MDYNFISKIHPEKPQKRSPRIGKFLVLGFCFLTLFYLGNKFVWPDRKKTTAENPPVSETQIQPAKIPDNPPLEPSHWRYAAGPISMQKIKTNGCVTDGILSGYAGHTKSMAEMIQRSDCVYLHRALETWLSPPDFEKAEEVMREINKPGLVYGMFIAEALKKNARYENPATGEKFDFNDMCQPDSKNVWGEHSCIPDIGKEAYREYLETITKQAMDLGIQSFTFGQVFLQDQEWSKKSKLPELLAKMRNYAKKQNLEIIIGAQTNSIERKEYLEMFDYIEGGVGLYGNGEIEQSKCFSGRSGCWALLWHRDFSQKAKHVFLHLDWTGILSDDMDVFARMDQTQRIKTLENLYGFFTSQNMGFLMPFSATVHKENPGCHSPKDGFYTPNKKYGCPDEDAINAIMPNP